MSLSNDILFSTALKSETSEKPEMKMCEQLWCTDSQFVKSETLPKRDKKWKWVMNLKMSRTAASLWIRRRIFNVRAFCRLADFAQLFALSSAVSLTLSLLVAGSWWALARRCLLTRDAHSRLSQLWGQQTKIQQISQSESAKIWPSESAQFGGVAC